jgi:hypothetical protein
MDMNLPPDLIGRAVARPYEDRFFRPFSFGKAHEKSGSPLNLNYMRGTGECQSNWRFVNS